SACSGDGCAPEGARQLLLASGTNRTLSRLRGSETTDRSGMSHCVYPFTTMPPSRFRLSGGSGVEEPVRIAYGNHGKQILREVVEALSDGLLQYVQVPALAMRSRMPGISNTARFSKRAVASRKRW